MEKEEKEDKEEIEQDTSPVKKKSIKKLIIIGLSALVVLGAGTFGTIYFLSHWGSAKKVATPETRPLIGTMWSIDPFIVNLADNQGERYLKVVMQLEISDPMVSAQLDQLKPKLRDNVMDLLTAKSYAELMDSGGKQRLRDEIVLRLNSFLTKGRIVKVYFTEFVIQ
jgi:flagellar protein FliL